MSQEILIRNLTAAVQIRQQDVQRQVDWPIRTETRIGRAAPTGPHPPQNTQAQTHNGRVREYSCALPKYSQLWYCVLIFSGLKLFKEPSFKSNKFIIHNALSRCCLAGKVNESQKKKIVEEMEKSPANHFLILFRDSSCQFRGVYTMNPDSQELVRLVGIGPRTISSTQVESIYKYSSDRKQFSTIPSKTMGMSVDAFTIPGHLWQGGAAAAAGGGGSRRASVTKKAVISK
uniref:CKK domain-containing protein n=1 Tax=Echeneis naucrates TaxID=173247 RepID=A0A665T5R7_ECHNA